MDYSIGARLRCSERQAMFFSHALSKWSFLTHTLGRNILTKVTFLRWLERPAQRSLRESQNGVRFPWKLRRIPIAWPRDRHVEEH